MQRPSFPHARPLIFPCEGREDGAKLDKIWITTASIEMTGFGTNASNCNGEEPDTNTQAIQKNLIDIGIYPNPATNEINISLPESPADIDIYSMEGNKKFTQVATSREIIVDMANLNPGIYFVKISNQGKTFVEKIIKR